MGGWPERFLQGLSDKSSAYWGRVGEDPIDRPGLESSDPEVRAAAIATFTDRADIIDIMRGNDLDIRAQIMDICQAAIKHSAAIPATANTPAC